MVVEIEGVQKLIRRIHQELGRAEEQLIEGESNGLTPFCFHVTNVLDDCLRVVSLILAETGHWQPDSFSNAVWMASQELAVRKEDITSITKIPHQADTLTNARTLYDIDNVLFGDFKSSVSILCQNLSDYLVHTELPI